MGILHSHCIENKPKYGTKGASFNLTFKSINQEHFEPICTLETLYSVENTTPHIDTHRYVPNFFNYRVIPITGGIIGAGYGLGNALWCSVRSDNSPIRVVAWERAKVVEDKGHSQQEEGVENMCKKESKIKYVTKWQSIRVVQT